MKKIVFNGKPFLRGDKRGVYRYTYEILKALDNYVKPGEVEILIPNVEENLPCFKNIKFIRYGNSRFFKGWQYIFYQYYILKNKALAVSTCPELSSFITKGIVTFHDMRIERKKGLTKTIKDYIKRKACSLKNRLFFLYNKYLIIQQLPQKEFLQQLPYAV